MSDELKAEIRAMVKWADESTPSCLRAAADRQCSWQCPGRLRVWTTSRSRCCWLSSIRSKQPYYFMVGLADIEQRAGNDDVAVDWLKQAYDSTTGPATRFQWGYYYLAGLIEMKPEEAALIHAVTVGLIDELQNSGGLVPPTEVAAEDAWSSACSIWSEEYGHAAELGGDSRRPLMTRLRICVTSG